MYKNSMIFLLLPILFATVNVAIAGIDLGNNANPEHVVLDINGTLERAIKIEGSTIDEQGLPIGLNIHSHDKQANSIKIEGLNVGDQFNGDHHHHHIELNGHAEEENWIRIERTNGAKLRSELSFDVLLVKRKELKEYVKEMWPDYEKDVIVVSEWVHKTEHADELLKVLLYISRIEESIYIGLELLKTVDKKGVLLDRIKKLAKKSVEHQEDEKALSFMMGTTGVVPMYMRVEREEALEEQVELGKLIHQIVVVAKKHEHNGKRRLFHKLLTEVVHDLKGASKKWSAAMSDRIGSWERGIKERLQQLSLKKVALGLKDIALWMFTPQNIVEVVQLILYFTNLSSPVKIPLEIISALGLDDVFTKAAAKMSVSLVKMGANQKLVMWMFEPNGLFPLFVRYGDEVDSNEVMASIDRASVWYYYSKHELGGHKEIRCKQRLRASDGQQQEVDEHKCKWKMVVWPGEQDEDTVERALDEHLATTHFAKNEERIRAQLEKEDIIRRADIWHYFERESEGLLVANGGGGGGGGNVKCKLMVRSETGAETTEKCKWSLAQGLATEEALLDHLSLDHLVEFEQRLKANREKDLPIRHLHVPMANSLTFFQKVSISLALNRGKPLNQLVDITIEHLRHWEQGLVRKWKRRWNRVKKIQFRDVGEAFKHAAMWLITPRHINNVINVILSITKLDGPIYLTMELMKAFGLTRYIVKMLDRQSLKIRNDYKGTKYEKLMLFMIGEDGVIRLFMNINSTSISGTANAKRNMMSTTGSVEFLNTVILTVARNPSASLHTLVFTVIHKLRDLRLQFSLQRGWNQRWTEIKESYNNMKDEIKEQRVEEIGNTVRLESELDWLHSRQTSAATAEDSNNVTAEEDNSKSVEVSQMRETEGTSPPLHGSVSPSQYSAGTDTDFLPSEMDDYGMGTHWGDEEEMMSLELNSRDLNSPEELNSPELSSLMMSPSGDDTETFSSPDATTSLLSSSPLSSSPLSGSPLSSSPLLSSPLSSSPLLRSPLSSSPPMGSPVPVQMLSSSAPEASIANIPYHHQQQQQHRRMESEPTTTTEDNGQLRLRDHLAMVQPDNVEPAMVPMPNNNAVVDQAVGPKKPKKHSQWSSLHNAVAGLLFGTRRRKSKAAAKSAKEDDAATTKPNIHNLDNGHGNNVSSASSPVSTTKLGIHNLDNGHGNNVSSASSPVRNLGEMFKSTPQKQQQRQDKSPGVDDHSSAGKSSEEYQQLGAKESDCPRKLYKKQWGTSFKYLLDQALYEKCRTVQVLFQKVRADENFLNQTIETIKNAQSEAEVPPVINIRLRGHISMDKQPILNEISPTNVMFLYHRMSQAGIHFKCLSDRPLEYSFRGPRGKNYILLLPKCSKRSSTKIKHFAIFRSDYFDDEEVEEAFEGNDYY